ncbi:MAG: 4-alpha-glucanotransferase [Bacteroidales bacterium]|nr:4-alpha-glucanotransferase [Bacteroidales bacterium]
MKITFRINYRTCYGQQLLVDGIPNQGKNLMTPVTSDGEWELTVDLKNSTNFKYRYLMKDNNVVSTLYEYGQREFVFPKLNVESVFVRDFWKPSNSTQNALLSSAFTNVIFKRDTKEKTNYLSETQEDSYPIRVSIPFVRVSKDDYVSVKFISSTPGNDVIVKLTDEKFPIWTGELYLKNLSQYIGYVYCICSKKTGKILIEEYVTRYLPKISFPDGTFIILNDEDFKLPRYPWKGVGVAIPVFSLRSNEGFGVGEFSDLIKLIDWSKKVGIRMIQLLPINDTIMTHTYKDSYPYACVSVFALHPMYLRISEMGNLPSKLSQEIYDERRNELNSLDKIDYERVMSAKFIFFKQIYTENKREFLQEPEYIEFFEKNSKWLKPYAVFSYLRDFYGTPDYTRWGTFSSFNQEKVDELCQETNPNFDDVAIHFFLQYHLHLQLSKVTKYARENGIILKGDIPIGIALNSVDAWVNPQLYNLESQAGAPPDDFSDDGQNWGFPTYNWDEMEKDGFSWWKERLQNMSKYFDAYRIDHILGFFRIWSVPRVHTRGLMGVFDPAIPISSHEFSDKNINFNYERFCTPYIREYMLRQIFKDQVGYVKHSFLEEIEGHEGEYRFKSEYDTQSKIEKAFATIAVPSTEEMLMFQKIKQGLIYLISELMFFPDQKRAGAFHPRHSLFQTYSYKDLDNHTKQAIAELYNDYFYNRNESLWKKQAEIKLPALTSATNMLVCGEDLGMIPACVPEVMKNLNIFSLEIQRMPKETRVEFGRTAGYPYLSIATTSSHDTLPIRGWWEEDHARSQRFYNNVLGKNGQAPFYCETSVVYDILLQHLYSPSMWAIFPIQDILGLDENLRNKYPAEERINVPSEPNHYWRYRCHVTLDQLLNANNLIQTLKIMLTKSSRDLVYY